MPMSTVIDPAASVRKTLPKPASAKSANTTPYLPIVYRVTNMDFPSTWTGDNV